MINKEIIINKKTRAIVNGENGDLFKLGVDSENLQENIVFKFEDEFVNGTARVEIIMQNNTKSYIMIDKVNETYVMPVKSVLTKKGLNKMQLVITQGTDDQEIPIFKSEMFNFFIAESINADTEQPEEYPQWIDKANTTLNEIDNFDIDAIKELNEATITITDRTGLSKSVKVYDGTDGINGKDAKINGVNTLSLKAGTNITLEQEDDELTINAEGGSGGGAVNSVNGMTGDVVIDIPVVPTNVSSFNNDSGYITKSVNDLTYYTKTSDLPTIPTNISAFNNDVGYLTQHQDISGKQDKIDSSHKLSSDLVDDTNNTNLFVSSTEKATWNGKSDFSGSYTDLTNKPDLNSYRTQIRENASTKKFDFDNEELGVYQILPNYYYFYYKCNNTSLSIQNEVITMLEYIKKYSEASINEVIANIVYYRNTANSNKGQVFYGNLKKVQNGVEIVSGLNYPLQIRFLTNGSQNIDGEKTFNTIPKQNNTNAPTDNKQFTNKKYVDDNIAKYSTMPTASSSYENQIAQFIGTTDSTYTNGYFYKCINNSGTYSWSMINVQDENLHIIYKDDIKTTNRFNFDTAEMGHYYIYQSYDSFLYTISNSNYSYENFVIIEMIINKKFSNATTNEEIGFVLGYDLSTNSSTNGELVIVTMTRNQNNNITFGTKRYLRGSGGLLTSKTQTITGFKIFYNLPEISSYTEPTTNTQFTPKKYVDDSITNKFWIGTQQEYDDLTTKDANVLYFIQEV